ncbi:MAG TPA: sigma-70 family RNA polymerase sigma factor, partial [Acidobacteriaceae bacterium]|nr:sigma-70 family RNA polymerase sigma factor [Acidobacteriaceae bacterium]
GRQVASVICADGVAPKILQSCQECIVRQPVSSKVLAVLLERREGFLRFLERRVGSREIAEDILQSGLVRALQQERSLRNEDSAVAWFYRILRNAVIDHYRQQAGSERILEQWAREQEPTVPPDLEMREAICGCIDEFLQDLKPEYREALQQIDLEEKSLKQFAAQVGISASNAGVRVHRARQALKNQLVNACGACAEHGCLRCDCPLTGSQRTTSAA